MYNAMDIESRLHSLLIDIAHGVVNDGNAKKHDVIRTSHA